MSASAGMDYMTVSMDVVFSLGSANGAMQCVSIVIEDADPFEGSETFTVTLTTASSVILTQSTTDITITESNGIIVSLLSMRKRSLVLKWVFPI